METEHCTGVFGRRSRSQCADICTEQLLEAPAFRLLLGCTNRSLGLPLCQLPLGKEYAQVETALVFSGIVLGATYVLAVRIGKLRSRLQEQRAKLASALGRIQALATRDDLTGLTNRRAALERMRDELAVRGRREPLTSLALLDIDHFKLFNDQYAHAAGDAVLRRFAECTQAVLRQGDLLARWGGEEFLLLMPATALEQAMTIVERARRVLAQLSFEDIAPNLSVTFSAGLSDCSHQADLDAAIARADAAMYVAKRSGRNRSEVAAKIMESADDAPVEDLVSP